MILWRSFPILPSLTIVKICCLPALNLFNFPVAVLEKRFAAALLVFNFGMIIPPFLRRAQAEKEGVQAALDCPD